MRQFKVLGVAMATAMLVAACGGGGGDGNQAPRIAIASVKVIGDSLADSGTFSALPAGSGYGRLFGVQGTDSKNFAELTAASYGISSLCNVYAFTGTTFIANPTAGCTNYGVGGGRINPQADKGGSATPFSIIKQLSDAGATNTYKASDLLIIDGGGNDAADLVGAYLKASTDGGAAFIGVLSSLPGTTLPTSAGGFPAAGMSYMTTLANSFFDAIKVNALDKGATHVAIINAPGILKTPRFQMVLDGIAAAYGGGAAGATARAQSEGLFTGWVEAFNAQLKTRATGESRVVLVDLYSNFNDYVAHPADYGLTNATTPACPMTGLGTDGLPEYNFETCTETALSAMTPPTINGVVAPGGANWWKTFGFSDGFHPAPALYKLASQLVNRSLTQAGWL
ncbi:SGNH/GDSL hydrolase family protein [Rhodoferax sp.]|uniref:SGNH/GDSL hydrolase family protein n=1 Tax=Rhodoferax sp. TaxID=50421 RepID=UPI00345C39AD